VSFAPATAGVETGALLFTTTSGTVTTYLSGIGLGAQATVDPGTINPFTTTIAAPAGIAVDNVGNLFVTDSSAGTLTEFPAGNAAGTVVPTGTLTLSNPQGVAVDALGDVFVADAGNNRIVEIPVVNGALTGASAFALTPVLNHPEGVAFDLQGDLLIADTGHDNLLLVPSVAGVLDFAAATSNGTGLDTPQAVTVDLNGNVFVAEGGAKNDVLEFAAPFGASAQFQVASSLSNPTSLATDASGSLFIVNNGVSSIVRLPRENGSFGTQTLAGSTVANPYGVSIDSAGNLYVTDTTNDVVAEVARVSGTLDFGGWNVGTTSTPLSESVNSSGTLPLTIASPSYQAGGQTTAGFSVTEDGCAGQTVPVGGACSITTTFTPPTTELNAEETLTLQTNATNGNTQISLIGTGANEKPSTLALTIAGPTPLAAGDPVTLSATVGTGSSTVPPGGSIKFYVNGTQVGTVAVANSQASISLKNGLPAGSAVDVSATYTGDVINYSGSTASLNVAVTALADTISLVSVTPWIGPASANDLATNPTGPSIGLTATLTISSTIIPNGAVTFYSGATVLGVSALTAVNGSTYTASINTTALRAGISNLVENDSYLTSYNDIYAVYGTDTIYAESTSNVLSVTVVGANPTANLANPITTGATFSVTPLTSTITVPTGQSTGSTTFTFISYGGWTGYVNFTCSGLPAYAQCAPFPGAPLVLDSSPKYPEPQTTDTFIINTNIAPLVPTASSTIWWVGGLSGLCLLWMRRRAQRLGSLPARRLLSLLLVALLGGVSVLTFSGCSTSSTASSAFSTPKGTYTINVQLSAAQYNANSSRTAPNDINLPSFQVTLKVQ
jgi:sugar lactone lactonase YvrE